MHFTLPTLQQYLSHYRVTKQFCPALHTVKCGLVSESVAEANPLLFICFGITKISNAGKPMISQVFNSLSNKMPRSLNFVLFSKNNLLLLQEKCCAGKCIPNVHCSPQFRSSFWNIGKLVLRVCTFFAERNEYP